MSAPPAIMPHAWQEGLLRHSILLMLATQVGNVANFLFQLVMMRRLSAEEYGVLATMLSLVLILGTPLEAMRTAVAHQVSLLARFGVPGDARQVVLRWMRGLALAGVLLIGIGLLLRAPMTSFFHMKSSLPLVLTVWVMGLSLFMPLFAGVMQGLQSFIWMSVVSQSWGIVRCAVGAALVVWVSQTASAGLLAQAVGALFVLVGGSWITWRLLRHAPGSDEVRIGGLSYFLRSLIVLAGFAVMMNADVALAKRFFDPEQAGLFAKCAAIARTMVFLPLPIAGAMFPKVASDGAVTAGDHRILRRAIAYTVLVILGAGLLCSLLASPLWHLFTGHAPTPDLVTLIRCLVWAMAPLGVTFLLVNYELAQHRFRWAYATLPLALIYLVSVSLWHPTPLALVAVLGAVSATSALLMLAVIFLPARARMG